MGIVNRCSLHLLSFCFEAISCYLKCINCGIFTIFEMYNQLEETRHFKRSSISFNQFQQHKRYIVTAQDYCCEKNWTSPIFASPELVKERWSINLTREG